MFQPPSANFTTELVVLAEAWKADLARGRISDFVKEELLDRAEGDGHQCLFWVLHEQRKAKQ